MQLGFAHEHGGEDVRRGLSLEGLPSGQHLENTQPNENTSLDGRSQPLRLLRRHVRGRAENDARLVPIMLSVGESAIARRVAPVVSIAFANPKSSTLTLPSGVTLTFAGLRSRWMMPFSCAASSASAICRATGAPRPPGGAAQEPLGHRLPFDQLHYEEMPAGGSHPVERGDVRVVERGEHLGFPLEAGDALCVGCDGCRITLIATLRPSLVSRAR